LGIGAYLIKPLKKSELLEAITTALGAPATRVKPAVDAGRKPEQGTSGRAPVKKLRVLLAEDNATNQLLASALLRKQGHEVVVAGNGKEALAVLETSGEWRADSSTPLFDVVLMDVQMPEMDGLEATGRIRALEQGRNRRLPIIAMTAHAMKGDRERCLETGMDGYVSKPIQTQDLLSAIAAVTPVPPRPIPEPVQ
jgi:CheY-like chemotaxis protein